MSTTLSDSLLEMLADLEQASRVPVKPGYEKVGLYICAEYQCDAGAEEIKGWDLSRLDLILLRDGLLALKRKLGIDKG